MKRQSIFLLSLALSLFLIGLPLAEGTMASGPTLRINIAPRAGLPGTVIGVTGEGAQTDKLVRVVFATSGEGGTYLAEVEVAPQPDGTFTATITVPEGTGDGTYAVRAEQTNPSTWNLIHYWYNNFVVTGAAVATATPEATAPTEATAPVVPTVTAEPTVSATGTVTATETVPPSATTAATLTPPGEMPTTGDQSSESNNTAVLAVAVLATLGILAALGAGLRRVRKT